MMNPLVAQLTHAAFPDLADALRSCVGDITREWDAAVREALPQMDRMTFNELKDSVPRILGAIADALSCSDPDEIKQLVDAAPLQGLSRIHQQYSVTEIMQEDRLLRAIIVLQTEGTLGRQMNAPEAAALHATVDVMLQRAVVALVDEQKAQLRAVAEREVKYLAYLSHDLHNDLSSVTLTLNVLRQQLATSPGFSEAARTVDAAQQCIKQTVEGMRRLLEHERLRKVGGSPAVTRIDLGGFVRDFEGQFASAADAKGLRLAVEAEPGAVVTIDAELVSLVLRNLIGNAIKYSDRGTIRLAAGQRREADAVRLAFSVSDEGPGISREHMDRIFEAFERGDALGQQGVGLGLAIASQAARLLGAQLTVESEVGRGSTFSLILPTEPPAR